MAHHGRREWLAAAVIALACGLLATSPATERLQGLSLDGLTALRWQAFGPRHVPAESKAVVVALDEETYATPPFQGSPTIAWTREIGRVLTAVVDGGAAVVGFDIVFPSSIEQSALPFGAAADDAVGTRLRGFDRDFLRALRGAASAGRLVLGEVQHGDEPVRPSAGQRIAVGQAPNIRSLNVTSDADEVVRRVPLAFMVDGTPVPAMALELASRARQVPPVFGADGSTTLAGWRVPTAVPRTMTLNFEGGADDVPTYSLADLRACAERGDADWFRRQFAGKVVIFGTLLDIEDRRATAKRFATGLERAAAPRCALPGPPATAAGAVPRRTIAGVYVHATAVNNLLRQDPAVELARPAVAALAVALAALAAAAALRLSPAVAALALLGLALAYGAGAVLAFQRALALPLVEPLLAAAAALVAMGGWRFAVTDREERLLRRSFALYLAPQLIDTMIESERLPALGGETREVTLFFSDIAGFSGFSEVLSPQALVALMNDYLSAMTDLIEAHGGYVDKYIGDSIVAVFGAPLAAADHATQAVRAALACAERLDEMNRSVDTFRARPIAHRIGINSGSALVGNVGSRHRFNYTAMGDAVNLASRLEGANKYFGSAILVAQDTVAQTGECFAWREIDAIRVKGRLQPVRVFEPLAEAGRQTPGQAARAAAYAEGLAAWRAADFAAAAAAFARVAASDAPAAMFEHRARELLAQPPGADWEPVYTLAGK